MIKTLINRIKFWSFIFLFVVSLSSGYSYAMDPLDNIPAREGLYYVNYPVFYSADSLKNLNGETTSDNLNLKLYQDLSRFSYYNKGAFGKTLVLTVVVPVGRIEMMNAHDAGLGDVTLAAGYFPIENPVSRTWLGVAGYVEVPIGNYDSQSIANMGSNIWTFRPSIGIAKGFGRFDLELTAKYDFHTENKDTHVRTGNELVGEAFLGYFIRPDLLLGGHCDAVFGNNMKKDGETIDETGTRVFKAGPSGTYLASADFGVTFKALYEFGAQNNPEGNLFLLRFFWKI